MIRRGGRPPRPGRPKPLATAAPWDPMGELTGLKDRLNHLFESALRRGGTSMAEGVGGWTPASELKEEANAFLLRAEVPGVPRDSLRLRLEGRSLTLEGVRPQAREARSGQPLRVERSYGAFVRTFALPGPVNETGVEARLEHGVLEVRLPKAARGRTGAVPVAIR
ncbi:MAG TPA: Hsp20/alpha crystallin family protein [Candidatus Polarisedimenticolia bacterium]|nr:Hsp20/alpha crystallin family protein [Candidatus Polarisedimenticolia bacterium]